MNSAPDQKRSTSRHPLLVRIATLTIAIGSLTALVVHSSLSAGCNRSRAEESDENPGADEKSPRAKGESGFMGTPKSGGVFRSGNDPSAGKPTAGTAPSATSANSQKPPAQAAPQPAGNR